MDPINYITAIRQFERLSLRKIARKTGFHFNTVKKYVDCGDWNRDLKVKNPRALKLDPLKAVIDEWLENDRAKNRSNRSPGEHNMHIYVFSNSRNPVKSTYFRDYQRHALHARLGSQAILISEIGVSREGSTPLGRGDCFTMGKTTYCPRETLI